MGADPQNPAWDASKAVDGNVSQNYSSNSCAITNVNENRIWWKVWLQRQFNVAYLEIYFRSDSEFPKNNSILVGSLMNKLIYLHLQELFLLLTFRAAITHNLVCLHLQIRFRI